MPEISFNNIKKYFADLKNKKIQFSFIYLIYGEEFLYKTALKDLVDLFLPLSNKEFNYEVYDGVDANIFDIIENLNTFSLLADTKVIALCDSVIFDSKHDNLQILKKIKLFFDKKDNKKASKYFLTLLGLLNIEFDDMRGENKAKHLKIEPDGFKWLDELIDYCVDNNLKIVEPKDESKVLQKSIEKGFSNKNYLIITTDFVDKRKALYKTIKEKGMIIDCSVPQGVTKSHKQAQENILIESMRSLLEKRGKKINNRAFYKMRDMSDFNLREFLNNLEKLIDYVGERVEITLEDVDYLLQRSKKDPIYEFTGAIADRSVEDSLFFMNSLLSSQIFPLQILTAMVNQIRKIMIAKDFILSPLGVVWEKNMQYNNFQQIVIPEIVKYDQMLLNKLEEWESVFTTDNSKAKKKKITSDLMIAKNPKNAFPIYKTFIKSEKFSEDELVDILEFLNYSDLRLKTTGQNEKLILEDAIMRICKGDVLCQK